jgi:hypothetical protein
MEMMAEQKLSELLLDHDEKNKIEKQFLLDMKARIYMLQNKDESIIYQLYKEACDCTINYHDFMNELQEYVLSVDEYYLIIVQLYYKYSSS